MYRGPAFFNASYPHNKNIIEVKEEQRQNKCTIKQIFIISQQLHIFHHACPNVDLVKPYNMATILILQDILAFFALNLKFHKSHTSAPKRKEMAYEFWADNIFSTHGLYTDV
jgi:hypothetical protein